MSHSPSLMTRRAVAVAAAAAVIAVPVTLIAATWQPLEQVPRANRADADAGEPDAAPGNDRERRRAAPETRTTDEEDSEKPRRTGRDTDLSAATPRP